MYNPNHRRLSIPNLLRNQHLLLSNLLLVKLLLLRLKRYLSWYKRLRSRTNPLKQLR